MIRRQFLQTSLCAAALSACASQPMSASIHKPLDKTAFDAERRFVHTRFGQVAYIERGAGPAVLFCHGYPLNGFQWRGAIERLAPHRRCIAPDFMGLGYSDVPEGQDLSPHAQVEMLCALLDALGVSAVDLIANDSGGTIAQLFLATRPERVRSVLLTTCEVHENNPPDNFRPVIALARSGALAQVFILASLQNPASARSPQSLGGAYTDAAHLTDECIEAYLRPLASSPKRISQFHAYTLALESNVLVAIEPALKQSQAPARIVWGDAASGFDVRWAHWLDATLPHSLGVRIVPGAKLFFPEEMPDLIAEEALALWRSPA